MVKKYKDLDIAVVSKYCDLQQRRRIEKYCRVYIHTNQLIECKVAIINYDQTIINYINEDAKIYQVFHADYTMPIYETKPKTNPRIEGYIAITKYLQDKMKDLLKVNNVMLSYNPLTIEDEQTIILVSATRLHKNKGKDRMQRLATELDKAKVNYIWYVITNDVGGIQSPNVIFIKNRLDINKFLSQATYVVLLSDSEACSYTLNEALYRNIPIITTPLPYLEEIGVVDGKNSYIMNFDCSNVQDIIQKITDVPKFEFKKLKDNYSNILAKNKSKYIPDKELIVKVRCIVSYYDDIELGERIFLNKEFEVNKERADVLEAAKVCKIMDRPL